MVPLITQEILKFWKISILLIKMQHSHKDGSTWQNFLILLIISFSHTLLLDCCVLSSYFVSTRWDWSYLSFLCDLKCRGWELFSIFCQPNKAAAKSLLTNEECSFWTCPNNDPSSPWDHDFFPDFSQSACSKQFPVYFSDCLKPGKRSFWLADPWNKSWSHGICVEFRMEWLYV